MLLSCIYKLQPFSLRWENFEELSIANEQYLYKVSYVLFQNCSVVLFMVFLSFRKLTGLLCLVCSLLFHSGVAEWSFLGVTGVVYSRKATFETGLVFSAD